MHTICHHTFDELAPRRDEWNRLAAGNPFRRWEWLSNWWDHYGADGTAGARLCLVALYDGDDLAAVAPLYTRRQFAQGRVISLLGTGEVYSDYLGILCRAQCESHAAESLARWLASGEVGDWDAVELTGVDVEDPCIAELVARLSGTCGAMQHGQGLNCWRIELPNTWDKYLATLSKNRRKQIRRRARVLDNSGQVRMHLARDGGEFDRALELLRDLHQRRWQELKQPGTYASPRFAAFLPQAARALFDEGLAQIYWLTHADKPVAVDLNLLGPDTLYAYQAGIDPDALEVEPGHLLTIATLRHSIENSFKWYDLLRGNEPYKANLRAQPRGTLELRASAPRATAALRHQMWRAQSRARRWVKSSLDSVCG